MDAPLQDAPQPGPISGDRSTLSANDEGKSVLVTGHWYGDFAGTVKHSGNELAIITDHMGKDIEVCYLETVRFLILQPEPLLEERR